MNDSSNICLACGLCCDGTLIGFVQLEAKELPELKGLLDIEEDSTGNGIFMHPCKNYCDGCTIYTKRPKQCAAFKCGLLKSVEQKDLDFDLAVETINVVKQKKIAIEKLLTILQLVLKSESFYFKMVELKKLLQKNKTDSAKHLELSLEIKELDSLLLEKFGVTLD